MTQLLERAEAKPAVRATVDGRMRAKALAQLKKKREFRTHLLAYALVNGALWAIWAIVVAWQGTTFPWPLFPMLGWGIGVAFHAWDVYGEKPFSEAQIQREIGRLAH